MTNTYTVHIYREMRLTYEGIEADSPQQAALEAKDGREGNAFEVDDQWQGEAFSALVVAEGDEENDQSPVIEFEAERQRKTARAQAVILNLVRYGFLTLADGDAEFDGVIYGFDDRQPDWNALVEAIGLETARAAIAEAAATDSRPQVPGTERVEISEDEFRERYPLVSNHLNRAASWASNDKRGCLFETYGEELDFVRQQNPRTVWTLVDGDDGDQYVLSGFHIVNRLGYLISTVPVSDGVGIQVHIPVQTAGDDRS